MIRKYALLIALVAMGGTLSVLLRLNRSIGTNVSESAAAAAIVKDTRSPVFGTRGADLTLVVFTDYQCPACRRSDPEMRRAIRKDGKIRVVYKDWPILGEYSREAARVALASSRQGIYSELHGNLMTASDMSRTSLRKAVEAAGGDWKLVQAELSRNLGEYDRQLVLNSNEAFALGLAGTPGYLIGPILVRGALDEREFLTVFDQARR